MNKNMRYVLKAVIIGALVLIALRLFPAKQYEGFATCSAPDKEPNSEHQCGTGYFCKEKDASKKCTCCAPDKKK